MVAAEPLKYIFGQTFFHEDGSVTGRIAVMQHPGVRNLWPDTMNLLSKSWTVWRFKFNTLLIILTVKRRSDLTRSLTLVTFSSVFDVQGLPQRGSSSTLSRPSKNALCHLWPLWWTERNQKQSSTEEVWEILSGSERVFSHACQCYHERSNTTFSKTQYYLAFIDDSCIHFRRSKYHLKYALASDHYF